VTDRDRPTPPAPEPSERVFCVEGYVGAATFDMMTGELYLNVTVMDFPEGSSLNVIDEGHYRITITMVPIDD
jgi:hypothetical protein